MAETAMTWLLSFADPERPRGKTFLGVIFVSAPDLVSAIRHTWTLNINPGGEVQGSSSRLIMPARYRDRLLTAAEADEAMEALYLVEA